MMKRRTANTTDNDGKQISPDKSQTAKISVSAGNWTRTLSLNSKIHALKSNNSGTNDSRRILFCAKVAIALVITIQTLSYLQTNVPRKQRRWYTPVPKKSRGVFVGTHHLAKYLKPRGYTQTKIHEDAEYLWGHTYWNIHLEKLKPWQRANHLPNEKLFTEKGIFMETMMKHKARTGEAVDFLPETYILYDKKDRRRFLNRLAGAGMYEAWVLKRPQKDGGHGVEFLGPDSQELKDTATSLRNNPSFGGQSSSSPTRLIVQKYVNNLLPYRGRKFDLRVYCLVASSVPFVAFYHDGTLRISLTDFDEEDFSSQQAHLTNWSAQRNAKGAAKGTKENADDARALLEDLGLYLEEYVSQNPRLSHIKDPISHVRDQMKDALATVMHVYRDLSFSVDATENNEKLYGAENGFSFMGGDFILDNNLKVWMTEMQGGPGTNHDAKSARENFSVVLPGIFEVLREVRKREMSGEPIDQMESPNTWELIYNDHFRFTYSGDTGGS